MFTHVHIIIECFSGAFGREALMFASKLLVEGVFCLEVVATSFTINQLSSNAFPSADGNPK